MNNIIKQSPKCGSPLRQESSSPIVHHSRSLRRNRFSLDYEQLLSNDSYKLDVDLEYKEENECSFLPFFTKLDESDFEDGDDIISSNSHLDVFIEKNNNMLQCKVCNKDFANLNILRRHVYFEIKGHDIIPGVSVIEYNQTETRNVNLNNNTCFICNLQFPTESLFDDHAVVHGNIFNCSMCETQCTSVKSYEKHMSIHFQNIEYPCTECTMLFDSKFAMKRHIRTDHMCLPHEKYQCPYCGIYVTDILSHANTHKKLFYKCELCSKKFKNKDCLTMHKEVHDEKDNFKCLICKRQYDSASDWNSHISYHEHGSEHRSSISVQGRPIKKCDKRIGPNYPMKCQHEYETFNDSKQCDTSDLGYFVDYMTKGEPKKRRLFQ